MGAGILFDFVRRPRWHPARAQSRAGDGIAGLARVALAGWVERSETHPVSFLRLSTAVSLYISPERHYVVRNSRHLWPRYRRDMYRLQGLRRCRLSRGSLLAPP